MESGFSHSQDGKVFANREKQLPVQNHGYYKEYTVITPQSNDRGAKRIITGQNGKFYYTDDHYQTFREIIK